MRVRLNYTATSRFSAAALFFAAGSVLCLVLSLFSVQYGGNSLSFPLVFCALALILIDVGAHPSFERNALLLSLFLRVGLIIRWIYFPGILASILGSSDAEKFRTISLEYFRGDFTNYNTTFPHYLNALYHLFSTGVLMPLFLNVVFWYLGWKILCALCDGSVDKKARRLFCLAYCFFPEPIIRCCSLLREAVMSFLIMLSFYYLIRWMKETRTVDILLAVFAAFIAMWFHGGNVAMLAGIFFTVLFWNKKEKNWRLSEKKIIAICVGLVAVFVFFYFRLYTHISYIPQKLSFKAIIYRYNGVGRTDYLTEMKVSGLSDFIFWAFLHCIYLWISPVITDWSSPLDPIIVLIDVLPLMFIFFHILKKPGRYIRTADKRFVAGLAILGFYTILYGCGTTNAGTALRHRDMLLGILLMTCALKKRRTLTL